MLALQCNNNWHQRDETFVIDHEELKKARESHGWHIMDEEAVSL